MSNPTKFRKKPVVIEAMRWNGSAEAAGPIISWALSSGGTIRYWGDGSELANPNCPTAEYHATHHYCPSCPFTSEKASLRVDTLEGTMRADVGDYIIRGVQGEFYPCKPDIFEATYEAVEVPELTAAENAEVIRFGIHPELDRDNR
jgi:hypothetical protein